MLRPVARLIDGQRPAHQRLGLGQAVLSLWPKLSCLTLLSKNKMFVKEQHKGVLYGKTG
jgi:hypothetical protein